MDSPFIFTKEVIGDQFVGRREELDWISLNILNGYNTVLIAPPRYGKTSLMRQALLQAQKQAFNLKFCYINLFNIRSSVGFYEKLATEALRCVCETVDDWSINVKNFFEKSDPRVEINNRINEVKVVFDPDKLRSNSEECIEFFPKYAEKHGTKICVCIEEFQNIEKFEDSVEVKKRLSKYLKEHEKISYIVSGGKKNAMRELFESKKEAFYQFGDIFTFQAVDCSLFADFITKSFLKSGRVIKKDQSEKLCTLLNGYPYYVQLLSHITWCNTKGFVTDQTSEVSRDELMDFCKYDFLKIIDDLSNFQINYLKAISDGVDRFCSSENIALYDFNSSANVARVRSALVKKEILEFAKHKPLFLDPVFELWFKSIYMN
ncbi:MAG: hypothetical protein LBC98_05180 [Prevotellaceae bacterium]|jgi:hypothetical protein|nr:hypothetical protein [Prevotellaceae bacterium]